VPCIDEPSLPVPALRRAKPRVRFERPLKPALGWIEVYGGVAFFLLLLARFVPLARLPFWGCALRRATGIPCLACGMTRSFDWFMQGRFLDSLAVNPLGFALALTGAIGALYLGLRWWRPPRLALELSPRQAFWVRIGAVALIAANWAYLVARALLRSA